MASEHRLRLLTAWFRREPEFLVIGAQKAGTTSLYAYLCQHPQIVSAGTIEVHYFDLDYARGPWWYRSHFAIRRSGCLTGEASPYYLFHPLVPERVGRDLPRVKLIVLLRNPVDRAYSHYQHVRRNGRESLTFEEAIECESERLYGAAERIREESGYRSPPHRTFSYLARGRYAEQLSRWFQHVPRDRFLVLRSEDMFDDPATTMSRTWTFLGLEGCASAFYTVRNPGGYAGQMSTSTRERLARYFEPHNRQLLELLGWDRGWEA